MQSSQLDKNSSTVFADSSEQHNTTPFVKSSQEDDIVVEEKEPVKERIVYKYIERPTRVTEEAVELTAQNTDTPDVSLLTNKEYSEKEVNYALPVYTMNQPMLNYALINDKAIKATYSPLASNVLIPQDLGLTAEVRGNHYWSFPKANVGYSTTPLLNNTSFALMYNVNDKFSAGFDLRQEYFYQEYEGQEEDVMYKYMQHPSYFSYGLTAKLRFLEFDHFNSFVQAYLGGNQAGPVGRLMYGMELNPGAGYRFILGIEGSMLAFHHSGEYFYTPKIGLHYGISFDF